MTMFNINAVLEIKTEVSIANDNALNEASWVLINSIGRHQEIKPLLFNNIKDCLKEAIEAYLKSTIKENKQ